MEDMRMEMDKNYEILMFGYAEACAVIQSNKQQQSLINAKNEALKQILSRCGKFMSEGFGHKLVETIFFKKTGFIVEAKSKTEIKEILKPSEIYDDYSGELKPRHPKYHVLEEELLMWSLTSKIGPLNSKALQRMKKAFSSVYPDQNIFEKEA